MYSCSFNISLIGINLETLLSNIFAGLILSFNLIHNELAFLFSRLRPMVYLPAIVVVVVVVVVLYIQYNLVSRTPGDLIQYNLVSRTPGDLIQYNLVSRTPGDLIQYNLVSRTPGDR